MKLFSFLYSLRFLKIFDSDKANTKPNGGTHRFLWSSPVWTACLALPSQWCCWQGPETRTLPRDSGLLLSPSAAGPGWYLELAKKKKQWHKNHFSCWHKHRVRNRLVQPCKDIRRRKSRGSFPPHSIRKTWFWLDRTSPWVSSDLFTKLCSAGDLLLSHYIFKVLCLWMASFSLSTLFFWLWDAVGLPISCTFLVNQMQVLSKMLQRLHWGFLTGRKLKESRDPLKP